MDDPAGNSYIQNFYAPDLDPEMKVIDYERNYEQRELLGLNDMKTENYGESDKSWRHTLCLCICVLNELKIF